MAESTGLPHKLSAVPGEQGDCRQYSLGASLLSFPKVGPIFHNNEETFRSIRFPAAHYKGFKTNNTAPCNNDFPELELFILPEREQRQRWDGLTCSGPALWQWRESIAGSYSVMSLGPCH